MPWTMQDYPQSWKNFEELERKKAIDIGNAMLKDGYKESDVIPIATNQAENGINMLKRRIRDVKTNISRNIKKMNQLILNLTKKNVHVYYEDRVMESKIYRG